MSFPVFETVAFVLALPGLAVLGHLVRQVGRRRRPLRTVLLGPGLLVGVALTAAGYAAVVYAIGFLSGVYILDPDQMCAGRAGFSAAVPDSSWLRIDSSYFPLRHTCRWADGTTLDLVPGWVNPLFYALLATTWAAMLARPLATLIAPGPRTPRR